MDTTGLYATHRIFTGVPISRGYVMDRHSGRVIWACPHRHRYGHAVQAQRCAERELSRMLAQTWRMKHGIR